MLSPRRGRSNNNNPAIVASPGHLERLANQPQEEEESTVGGSPIPPSNLDGTCSPNSRASPSQEEMAAAAAAAAAAIGTPATDSGQNTRKAKKNSPPGTTTARKKKKKKDAEKIKVGCRLHSTRKALYLCGRLNDKQTEKIKEFP